MKFTPDFEQLLAVLKRRQPDRPVLFELFMTNAEIAERFSGIKQNSWDMINSPEMSIAVNVKAGYDYISMYASDFNFPTKAVLHGKSFNMNEDFCITNREEFNNYPFPDAKKCSTYSLKLAEKLLPDGMKVIVFGPCGVLENVTRLVGFDNMCLMLYDDKKLLSDIFQEVGERLIEYYELAASYDCVGAVISNDDWGFIGGTMMSPENMRELVFPYHKKIVELAHKNGKSAILHSCGNLEEVYDDIIFDMKFDAKHSFEDKIMSVEDSWKKYGDKIAILGGLDVDFVSRSTPETIEKRAIDILNMTKCKGYALGTGNSIADYISYEKFFAMTNATKKVVFNV